MNAALRHVEEEATAPASVVTTISKAFSYIADINREHRLAQSCVAEAVEHAIRCGELLIAQKSKLAHGSFRPWIKMNCEIAYSTAARYMKAAREKSTGVDFSTLSELFQSGRKCAEKSPQDSSDDADDCGSDDNADEEAEEEGEGVEPEDTNFEPALASDQPRLDELSPQLVTCPHCKQEFDAREQLAP